MAAVSTISTRKVLWPRAMLSCAPTRVRMRSTSPIRAERAGTKLPIWAIRVSSATWRMNTLLPLMFGPVRIMIWQSAGSRRTSLGVNGAPEASRTGWRPSTISSASPVSISGRTYARSWATAARAPRASRVPTARAVRSSGPDRAATCARTWTKSSNSSRAMRSSAPRTRLSYSLSSVVT